MGYKNLLNYYQAHFGQAVKQQGNGWNGPCPLCGGQPGKSDRFMVWPDRSESLGELCAKNNITGIWSCRQCGNSGDTIAYLTKCEGMSFKEALSELGIEGSKPVYKRKRAPVEKVSSEIWTPKLLSEPTLEWHEHAQKLVSEAEKNIWDNGDALGWLFARGIDEAAIRKYRIGYLKAESEKYQGRFRPRSSFGLQPKIGEDGKTRDKIFIPRGILIPTLGKSGSILNIRIRRHKADLQDHSPKYLELEGSYRGPMFLESSQSRHLSVYYITEAELDAILIHHTSEGVVGAIAVRTNRGKPDTKCHSALEAAVRICIALDYDEAGADGCDFWEKNYPNSMRWPTPDGKDPGDAYGLGVDIREWIIASLPACVSLSCKKETPNQSVSQQESEILSCPENGQKDITASGRVYLGEGETEKPKLEKGNWPSIERARIHARAMAEDYTMEIDRWNKTQPIPFPMASINDFAPQEFELLKKELLPAARLENIYLDVAVIWLLWRKTPAIFIRQEKDGKCTGFKWELNYAWIGKNESQFDLFWRYQTISRAFWDWLSHHPAKKITSENILHL